MATPGNTDMVEMVLVKKGWLASPVADKESCADSQVRMPHSEVPGQLQTGNLGLGTSLTVALNGLLISADDNTRIFESFPNTCFFPHPELLGSIL